MSMTQIFLNVGINVEVIEVFNFIVFISFFIFLKSWKFKIGVVNAFFGMRQFKWHCCFFSCLLLNLRFFLNNSFFSSFFPDFRFFSRFFFNYRLNLYFRFCLNICFFFRLCIFRFLFKCKSFRHVIFNDLIFAEFRSFFLNRFRLCNGFLFRFINVFQSLNHVFPRHSAVINPFRFCFGSCRFFV